MKPKNISNENVQLFHEYSLDLTTRTIVLESDAGTAIDNAALTRLSKNLTLLENQSTELPITLILNSEGGDVPSGMGMFNRIKSSPCPIIGVVQSQCCSMAAVVIQACDKRMAYPGAIIMAHEGGYSSGAAQITETYNEVTFDRRYLFLIDDIVYHALLTKNPKMSKQRFRKLMHEGLYLLAEEAVEHGLIDGVIS